MTAHVMNNWRIKLFGSGGFGYIAFDTAAKLLDGDPATNPDWMLLGGGLFALISALYAAPPGSKPPAA